MQRLPQASSAFCFRQLGCCGCNAMLFKYGGLACESFGIFGYTLAVAHAVNVR